MTDNCEAYSRHDQTPSAPPVPVLAVKTSLFCPSLHFPEGWGHQESRRDSCFGNFLKVDIEFPTSRPNVHSMAPNGAFSLVFPLSRQIPGSVQMLSSIFGAPLGQKIRGLLARRRYIVASLTTAYSKMSLWTHIAKRRGRKCQGPVRGPTLRPQS